MGHCNVIMAKMYPGVTSFLSPFPLKSKQKLEAPLDQHALLSVWFFVFVLFFLHAAWGSFCPLSPQLLILESEPSSVTRLVNPSQVVYFSTTLITSASLFPRMP